MLTNKKHQLIMDVMNSLTDEELIEISKEVKEMQLGGPTIEEYLESFNSHYHEIFPSSKLQRTGSFGEIACFINPKILKNGKSQVIPYTEKPEQTVILNNIEATSFGGALHLTNLHA